MSTDNNSGGHQGSIPTGLDDAPSSSTIVVLGEWHLVESSVLKAVRYTAAFRAMDISFVNGRLYRYLNVSGQMCQALLAATSKGRWFGKELRPYSVTYPCFELEAQPQPQTLLEQLSQLLEHANSVLLSLSQTEGQPYRHLEDQFQTETQDWQLSQMHREAERGAVWQLAALSSSAMFALGLTQGKSEDCSRGDHDNCEVTLELEAASDLDEDEAASSKPSWLLIDDDSTELTYTSDPPPHSYSYLSKLACACDCHLD